MKLQAITDSCIIGSHTAARPSPRKSKWQRNQSQYRTTFQDSQFRISCTPKMTNLRREFYVLLTVHPCVILQINPTSAQFCLVYLFLFSTCFGQPCPHHQEKLLYLCDTGACHSVWAVSGLLVGVSLQPADQTPPIQSDKHQCRIDTVISPDDGHTVARNK